VIETWRVRKGGLGPCPGTPLLQQKKLDCQRHEFAGIAGSDYCWNCGAPYSKEEKNKFATLREIEIEKRLALKAETEAKKSLLLEEPSSSLLPLD